VTAHHNILQDHHISKEFNRLEGSGNPFFCNQMGFLAVDYFPFKMDCSSCWREDTCDDVEEGGLSCTVWSDDRLDLARDDRKI